MLQTYGIKRFQQDVGDGLVSPAGKACAALWLWCPGCQGPPLGTLAATELQLCHAELPTGAETTRRQVH
jgi:hypothetical protein